MSASASASLDLSIDSSDIIRLIEAYLTENGLHDACSALRDESGIHAAGASAAAAVAAPQFQQQQQQQQHSCNTSWAQRGDWGSVLSHLETIQTTRIPSNLLGDVYESAILELADNGHIQLAYATLRLVAAQLDQQTKSAFRTTTTNTTSTNDEEDEHGIPRSRLLEQRLAALLAMRNSSNSTSSSNSNTHLLPRDYYGANAITKQQRRDNLGMRLSKSIPRVPPDRLTALLQQAIKWQSHTGQLALVKDYWDDDDDDDDDNIDNTNVDNSIMDKHNHKQDTVVVQKIKPKKRRRTKFDLVLGESSVAAAILSSSKRGATAQDFAEPIPSKIYSTISFGTKATAEVALFLPDGSGLVTGSSDGLIEIWSPTSRYKELRMDLPYQQNDQLLGHDGDNAIITAMAVSNDGRLLATGDATGMVKVWNIDNGTCLRNIAAHPNSSISCLSFSPDASHILTASIECREYGLRTNRLLKEFRGHSSFCNTCQYYRMMMMGGGGNDNDGTSGNDGNVLRVITASADGTARIYNGKTSEVLLVLRPSSLGTDLSKVGMSIVQQHRLGDANLSNHGEGSPNLHTVIPLHTPAASVVLVPRASRAFLVSLTTGIVLRTFDCCDSSTTTTNKNQPIFVAATVSPTNQWLYCVTDAGTLHVFSVTTGDDETVIRNFGHKKKTKDDAGDHAKEQTSTSRPAPEITIIIHHPHKGILGAFSNDKSQKRGVLTLWK